MLFYDQNGALGQFQGFNNVTHEYRINNIASSGIDQFHDRLLPSSWSPNGNIGIGTTPSPSANLDVSNAVSGSGTTNVNVTSYTKWVWPQPHRTRRPEAQNVAPTAVLNNNGFS